MLSVVRDSFLERRAELTEDDWVGWEDGEVGMEFLGRLAEAERERNWAYT